MSRKSSSEDAGNFIHFLLNFAWLCHVSIAKCDNKDLSRDEVTSRVDERLQIFGNFSSVQGRTKDSPEKEGQPAGQKRRHDDPQCSRSLSFPPHFAAVGDRWILRLWIRRRLIHGGQRGQTRRNPVDLQMLVQKRGRHFAPANQTKNMSRVSQFRAKFSEIKFN